jgi:hypothetical protein
VDKTFATSLLATSRTMPLILEISTTTRNFIQILLGFNFMTSEALESALTSYKTDVVGPDADQH